MILSNSYSNNNVISNFFFLIFRVWDSI
jgi:hypothetical protein